MIEHDPRLEALGMLEEALHQVGPLYAVYVGRPVVDIGGGHELAALREAGHEHRLEIGAGGIERSGVARGAGAEDQDLRVLCLRAVHG